MQSRTNAPRGARYVLAAGGMLSLHCDSAIGTKQKNSFKDRQNDIPYIALSVSTPRRGGKGGGVAAHESDG
jgi:hypothetical protein